MAEILELKLDEVHPDPDQPRRFFDADSMGELRVAMNRWGQLEPIRVRKDEEGRYVIVDGERRWRAMQELCKDFPEDEKFYAIKAFEGADFDQDPKKRKAIQLLSNSTGRDLAPSEKAILIHELQSDGVGSDKALQEQFGISKGQLRYLSALARAPEFLQGFGLPQKYEVEAAEGAKGKKIVREFPPLGLSLLSELIALYNKLVAFDGETLRKEKGAHKPVATVEIRKLGERAQREGWSKAQLQKRCAAVHERLVNPTRRDKNGTAAVDATIQKLHTHVERLLGSGAQNHLEDVAKVLRAMLERIEGTGPTSFAEQDLQAATQ